jgi:hypothetical protein
MDHTMMQVDDEIAPQARWRAIPVVLLLTGAAAVFSYLGAYAVMNALEANGIVAPWPAEPDPRPHWMAMAFIAQMTVFITAAMALGWMSSRQFKRIDAMVDSDVGEGA